MVTFGGVETTIYNFKIDLNWQLVDLLRQIDRFDASWLSIERNADYDLKQLKSIATIQSTGSSTRIEGSSMSDEAVEELLKNLDINKLSNRDAQEVAGYFETLDLISEGHGNIDITENNLKSLHKTLLQYSTKDEWHRGDFKKHNNSVEAIFPDGNRQLIFATTEAGYPTEIATSSLLNWYNSDQLTHPLVRCAAFVYDFVSIHPFQDGNGRLCRLISSLLLLKHGYRWIEYVSFEHEIEKRKNEYYKVLRACQAMRPNENISQWVIFFLSCLKTIQEVLMLKLNSFIVDTQLNPREQAILRFIRMNPGCRSGEIANKLGMAVPTIKKALPALLGLKLIRKYGAGAGTNYSIH